MLGLGSSISKTSKKSAFSPTRIKDLVGWWDFSDSKYIYSDSGSTSITNGDSIQQINNKAFHLQNGNVGALGTHLTQGTSGNKPLWSSSGYATFDGSDDYLIANITSGNVATNKLSETTLNTTGMTMFYVVNTLNSAGISSDEILFHARTTNSANHRFSFYIDDNSTNDQWGYIIQDDSARSNLQNQSGRNITANIESWTVLLDSTSANSIYVNNNASQGIANGTSSNTNYNFSENEANIAIFIGGIADGNNAKARVYQVLIYDRALDAKEIELVNRYLNSRNKIF